MVIGFLEEWLLITRMLQIVTSRVSEEFMILCTALILRRCVHNILIPVAHVFGYPVCLQLL
jgi:hypothetical protein